MNKLQLLITVRIILGILSVVCWFRFGRAIEKRFGKTTAYLLNLITLVQFHPIFYASRTLPNTFAMLLVNEAYTSWINFKPLTSIFLLSVCAGVFRFEVGILAFGIALVEFCSVENKIRLPFIRQALLNLSLALMAVSSTILVESYFWKKLVWPEAAVFYFNIVQNKSRDWGTSPWHWYLLRALPNLYLFLYPMVLIGAIKSKIPSKLLMPSVIFIFLFSILPHKELRFIFPAIPILNLFAASGASNLIFKPRTKRMTWLTLLLKFTFYLALFSCLALNLFRVYISSKNYPGAEALLWLQRNVPEEDCMVHIDPYTAMNGCSRFLELRESWKFDKAENLNVEDYKRYTHLLAETPISGFETFHTIYGFSGISVKRPSFSSIFENPVRLEMNQKVHILKKIEKDG